MQTVVPVSRLQYLIGLYGSRLGHPLMCVIGKEIDLDMQNGWRFGQPFC